MEVLISFLISIGDLSQCNTFVVKNYFKHSKFHSTLKVKIWMKLGSQQTFLDLKKSSRCLQDMSWGRLQHVFSETIFSLQRRSEDIFKNFCKDVLKMSWRNLRRRLEDVLKTPWKTKDFSAEDVFKTSWRHVLKQSWRHVLKMSWGHVLKTS